MHTAQFKFHNSLNDFLLPPNKDSWISYSFNSTPAVKDAIEAIGIPHVEVKDIFINDSIADFYQPLHENDKVEVHPFIHIPSSPQKFILDVHLGKLAKLLRLLGFDTLYQNNFDDKVITTLAVQDERIVLTRNIALLKIKTIELGYWLRSQQPVEQAREVLDRFVLKSLIQPFKRCLVCNGLIEAVNKEDIVAHLPANTINLFDEFYQCKNCKRVYWKGSHYERMLQLIEDLVN
ncbi:MAG: Mut7-C RNAse domain-containing protein [Flavisolibacter sp.]